MCIYKEYPIAVWTNLNQFYNPEMPELQLKVWFFSSSLAGFFQFDEPDF
jgi:hypothetical protein